MTRSRLVVLVSTVVVGTGVLAGLSALYLDPARAAVGPVPAEGLVLPADARFVMGVDVKRLTSSPFYKKQSALRPDAFRDLEARTGVNPERDVDTLLVAGNTGDQGLALLVGTFDRARLARTIETEKKGQVTWKDVQGTTVYLFREGQKGGGAAAFLDDRRLVVGTATAVEAAVAAKVSGATGLKSNLAMSALLERVKPGSTFWMVGDQTLLANLPKSMPMGGGESTVTLPALKSVVVTGDLDPMVSLAITGDAADEASAKNLADVVRGFVAIMSMQGGQKPELKQLASAVSVTTDTTHVLVSARFPYELIDALSPKRAAAADPSTASPVKPVAPAVQ
jgi:hypothetical protein